MLSNLFIELTNFNYSWSLSLCLWGISLGVLTILSQLKHILMVLFGLEILVLNIFMLLMCSPWVAVKEGFILMIFLSMAVCEAVLGLAILVAFIRTQGNDYINIMMTQKF